MKKASLAVWLTVAALVGFAAYLSGIGPSKESPITEISYSDFMSQAMESKIHDVTIAGREVTGHFKEENRQFTVITPDDPAMIRQLQIARVQITAAAPADRGWWLTFLINMAPILVFAAVWIYFSRRAGAGGQAMGFGKSKAKLHDATQSLVTFEDVAGVDEAKDDLKEVVEFLRDPAKFERLGGRIPRGVLLIGPPGTGKTLLARAVAGEAGVPFFSTSGSDFVEMFVGVGASRVRDMFEQAKKNAPCIVFVDEIDAVGRSRGVGMGGGNDEREQTLNQLLVEMDGFEPNSGVIVIAATNREDVLDSAILRPGRFDRQVHVANPDVSGRVDILKIHARKVPLAGDVDLDTVARCTPGFSGADLMNLVNEAALLAARRSKRVVTRVEFDDARDKILMGAERRSLSMTDEDKQITAYHEGGHALVSVSLPGLHPIHKATIVPRGKALGMVQSLPERDEVSQTKEHLISQLAMAMGGRAAEELVFGEDKTTSGAASDIQMCTRIAHAMVTKMGFSPELGMVAYEPLQPQPYHVDNHSEETRKKIDAEVKKLVDTAYFKAKKILRDRREDLDALASALLEFESLTGEEIATVLRGEKLRRVQPPAYLVAEGSKKLHVDEEMEEKTSIVIG